VAFKVGLPPAQVFKTLVLRGSSGSILMAAVPATAAIDLKALARIAKEKSVEMVQMKELLPLTGYIRGGVSPIGSKKKYPFYLDQSAQNHSQISISAGKRGLQILLAPSDLVRLTQATMAVISINTQQA
jgi:Cys-tRNA(Pro)/Cys-tRNA(Cys) deacylase